MQCPRCGVSTLADRSSCPACNWHLSRPYAQDHDPLLPPRRTAEVQQPEPSIQTAADAFIDPFVLTPPRRQDRQHQSRRRRSFARRRRDLRAHAHALAAWPTDADWPGTGGSSTQSARFELIEATGVQSAFDFEAAEQEAELLAGRAAASVGLRFQAGLLDAVLILLAGGLFFGLFALLGGRLDLGRRDLLIYMLSGYALATLYFGLFTLFGGRTPGMQHYGLKAVTFEGKPLPRPQAIWRAFGYAVSTGALLLGFVWAMADERHLTWHDHISRTFLTDRTLL